MQQPKPRSGTLKRRALESKPSTRRGLTTQSQPYCLQRTANSGQPALKAYWVSRTCYALDEEVISLLTWPLGAEVARLTDWPSRALEESAEAIAMFVSKEKRR